jgi:hypothetical protein
MGLYQRFQSELHLQGLPRTRASFMFWSFTDSLVKTNINAPCCDMPPVNRQAKK